MTATAHDIWSTEPFLGLVPHFHTDPAQGGVPLVSTDGHWWWDGYAWTPAPSVESVESVEEADRTR